jgi:hypothetical protein
VYSESNDWIASVLYKCANLTRRNPPPPEDPFAFWGGVEKYSQEGPNQGIREAGPGNPALPLPFQTFKILPTSKAYTDISKHFLRLSLTAHVVVARHCVDYRCSMLVRQYEVVTSM